jgi:Hydantoinase/oxoprolinase N-terminal region
MLGALTSTVGCAGSVTQQHHTWHLTGIEAARYDHMKLNDTLKREAAVTGFKECCGRDQSAGPSPVGSRTLLSPRLNPSGVRVTSSPQVRLGVDIGGTFTDVALEVGERRLTAKLLTTPRAPEEGVLAAVCACV